MVIASCRYYPIDNQKEGIEMELDERKITVRQDQLEKIYRLAEQITGLYDDAPAYSLGYAQATASHIQSIIRSASHNKVGGIEKEGDNDE
jgi:hypothetical protein